MKFLKSVNPIVLCLLLISCGPAALPPAESVPVMTETPEPEIIVPEPWEGVTEEWTFFNSLNYFSSYVYDPSGYIWLTSGLGVLRLDLETKRYELLGKPETYSSGSNYLTFFDGRLWMVSSKGHVAYLSNGLWQEQEILGGYSYGLVSTGDLLWYIGSEEILYLENDEWKTFEFPEEYDFSYNGIAKAGDGSLWFSSYEKVVQFDGVNWIEHDNLLGLGRMVSLAGGEVLFIYDTLILVYDGTNIRPLVLPGERFRYSIRNSFSSPDGGFWFQIYAQGTKDDFPIYLVTSEGVEEIPSVVFDDFPDPNIYSPVLMTPRGWVFVNKSTLYLFDGQDWEEYPLNRKFIFDMQQLGNPIGFSPEGKLWFMNGNRPVGFDGKEIEDPFEENGCEQYYDLGEITPDGKGIWLGSSYRNTMCYFDLENERKIENDLYFNMSGMDIAPDGSIWVSSEFGFIARITPYLLGRGDYRLVEQIKVGGEDVSTLLSPSRILVDSFGAVWVYVKGYGVYQYKDGVWTNFGMAEIDQTSLAVDSNGDVWVGKPGKLFKHEKGKWIEFPQACICPTNLTITPNDIFWFVNGCNGVYMYNKETWMQFTAEDMGGFTPSKILAAPDGAVWFFDYNHWTRYKPEE